MASRRRSRRTLVSTAELLIIATPRRTTSPSRRVQKVLSPSIGPRSPRSSQTISPLLAFCPLRMVPGQRNFSERFSRHRALLVPPLRGGTYVWDSLRPVSPYPHSFLPLRPAAPAISI